MSRTSRWMLLISVLALGLTVPALTADKEEERLPNRPKVPGKFRLTLRERKEGTPKSGKFQVAEKTVDWEVSETAIIVCDMWDDLYCKSAAQRVGVLVPRMNAVLTAARNHGAMIIHAPSDTMNMYAETPYRKRMQQAKATKPPVPIAKWCYLDETREPAMPVDTSKCACDDALLGPIVKKYTKEHAGLDIVSFDGVSDSGEEIFNFCEQEGIKNVVLMGVHTNMCVLGRSFGIRQMVVRLSHGT
ncbi:MAG: isochorismatase family protein [Gemmataceae bacterium]|nr:isochorismatase family protein [Gemmataceae bacterium]